MHNEYNHYNQERLTLIPKASYKTARLKAAGGEIYRKPCVQAYACMQMQLEKARWDKCNLKPPDGIHLKFPFKSRDDETWEKRCILKWSDHSITGISIKKRNCAVVYDHNYVSCCRSSQIFKPYLPVGAHFALPPAAKGL